MLSSLSPSEKDSLYKLANFVSEVTGVLLEPERHDTLIRTRIKKRVMELGLRSYEAYYNHFKENQKSESAVLISLLTTQHTYFFREFQHFEHLKKTLPSIVEKARKEGRSKIRVWSAASSYGHEAYSVAMFLDFYLKKIDPQIDFEIFGSDVNETAVNVARNGVYRWSHLKESPSMYLSNHWQKGTGAIEKFVKLKKHLKNKVDFRVVNLKTLSDSSNKEPFDYIFCRNVFIYFSKTDIAEITNKLMKRLLPNGFLYLGLSETLHGLDVPTQHIGNSIYSHKGAAKPSEDPQKAEEKAKPQGPLKVLCVDDSPTILTVLKKILTKEAGFEIVGTAKNGLEAQEAVQKLNPDVVTLDIHMPKQNGLEYLKSNYNDKHPPVLIVSSVSREDKELGIQVLKYGASDYVEKPSLKDMKLKGNEIISKIKTIVTYKNEASNEASSNTDEKMISISDSESKLCVIYAGIKDIRNVENMTKNLEFNFPPTLILLSDSNDSYEEFDKNLDTRTQKIEEDFFENPKFEKQKVYISEFKYEIEKQIEKYSQDKQVSHIALVNSSNEAKNFVSRRFKKGRFFEEESNPTRVQSKDDFDEVVPATSLMYETKKYFADIEIKPASSEKDANKEAKTNTKGTSKPATETFTRYKVQSNEALFRFFEPISRTTDVYLLNESNINMYPKALEQHLNSPTHRSKESELKVIYGSQSIKNKSQPYISIKPITSAGEYIGKGSGSIDVMIGKSTGRLRVSEKANQVTSALNAPTLAPISRSTENATPAPITKKDREIKVLLVDDSKSMLLVLSKIFQEHPGLRVVGKTTDPTKAEDLVRELNPDVITLDIKMPVINGVQLLEKLYPKYKIPTVMISSLNPNESTDVMKSLELGAFDFVQKPSAEEIKSGLAKNIARTIELAAESKDSSSQGHFYKKANIEFDPNLPLIIGSSTGGTEAIKHLFQTFPDKIPPVLISQHIPAHFSKAWADRLNELFPFEIREAEHGDSIKPNKVLIAPGDYHMEIEEFGPGDMRVSLNQKPHVNRHRPSVDVMFDSAAKNYGKKCIGIILTGMGADGGQGMVNMKNSGAHTIGESKESCVVYGMPRVAYELGGVKEQVDLNKISESIDKCYSMKPRKAA